MTKVVTDELTMYAQTVSELRKQKRILVDTLSECRAALDDWYFDREGMLAKIDDALKQAGEP